MKVFPSRKKDSSSSVAKYDSIVSKLDSALDSVFTKDGKKTVLYFLNEKYSLSLEGATTNPERLEAALTNLLGEIGWKVVQSRILEEFSLGQPSASQVPSARVSLGEVFGAFRLLRPSPSPF